MADEVRLEVPAELDGERLDKALASILGLSRAQARLLADQGVTVDGALAKASDRVSRGAKLLSPLPEEAAELQPEPVDFSVLWEDESVIVVDKPPGLAVHPGSGTTKATLASGLLYRYPELKGVGQPERWGLVHRLDKDTSGALLVGRTPDAYEALAVLLKRRRIQRFYTTLAHGTFGAPTGTIDSPIGRDPVRPTRRAVVPGGKQARTHYEVVRAYQSCECSLLEVRLETGRTHQIRVHLSAIDHPVIGDRAYGGGHTTVESPRMFLHSSRVVLPHPDSGVTISVESPLPRDLQIVLDSIEGNAAG